MEQKDNDHVIGKIIPNENFLKGSDHTRDSMMALFQHNWWENTIYPMYLPQLQLENSLKCRKIKSISAIENYVPSNSRSQLIEKDSNKIILDAYNANPSSMKLAIENFAKKNSENKILMLGAMAELGKQSLQEHQGIIDLIKKYSWKEVVLVGGDFLKLPHSFSFI